MDQIIFSTFTKEEWTEMFRTILRQEIETALYDQPQQHPKEYLCVDEVCDMYHISKSTLYKLTSSREIPSIKTGKRLLLRKEDLDYYMQQHYRMSANQIRATL